MRTRLLSCWGYLMLDMRNLLRLIADSGWKGKLVTELNRFG